MRPTSIKSGFSSLGLDGTLDLLAECCLCVPCLSSSQKVKVWVTAALPNPLSKCSLNKIGKKKRTYAFSRHSLIHMRAHTGFLF
jgi:hypothetical protein